MSEDTGIYIAVAADVTWIKKIYAQAKKEIGSFNLWHSWDDFVSGKRGTFLVIRPKAFVRYTQDRHKNYWVQEIAVDKEFREQGLAYKLMMAVPKPLFLKCNQDNINGNEFYKGIGMQFVKETTTKTGKPQNVYHLCAELSDTSETSPTLL